MTYADGFVCTLGVQSWCFKSTLSVSDWAAWVQAIGSVAAILASAGVVWWQVRKQHRLQTTAEYRRRLVVELDFLRSIVDLGQQAIGVLGVAEDAMRDIDNASHYFGHYNETQKLDLVDLAIHGADFREVQTPALALALLSAQRAFKSARAQIDTTGASIVRLQVGVCDRLRNELTWRRLEMQVNIDVINTRAKHVQQMFDSL